MGIRRTAEYFDWDNFGKGNKREFEKIELKNPVKIKKPFELQEEPKINIEKPEISVDQLSAMIGLTFGVETYVERAKVTGLSNEQIRRMVTDTLNRALGDK